MPKNHDIYLVIVYLSVSKYHVFSKGMSQSSRTWKLKLTRPQFHVILVHAILPAVFSCPKLDFAAVLTWKFAYGSLYLCAGVKGIDYDRRDGPAGPQVSHCYDIDKSGI